MTTEQTTTIKEAIDWLLDNVMFTAGQTEVGSDMLREVFRAVYQRDDTMKEMLDALLMVDWTITSDPKHIDQVTGEPISPMAKKVHAAIAKATT